MRISGCAVNARAGSKRSRVGLSCTNGASDAAAAGVAAGGALADSEMDELLETSIYNEIRGMTTEVNAAQCDRCAVTRRIQRCQRTSTLA